MSILIYYILIFEYTALQYLDKIRKKEMHPLIEYAFVVVGLLVGFQSGGYLGYFLVSFSLVAGVRQYMQGGQCRSTRRLEGKTAVITGANTGIGRVTAADLARRGAKVIILCRDLAKAESAAVQIR